MSSRRRACACSRGRSHHRHRRHAAPTPPPCGAASRAHRWSSVGAERDRGL
jgi:hypothetical protein